MLSCGYFNMHPCSRPGFCLPLLFLLNLLFLFITFCRFCLGFLFRFDHDDVVVGRRRRFSLRSTARWSDVVLDAAVAAAVICVVVTVVFHPFVTRVRESGVEGERDSMTTSRSNGNLCNR